MKTIAQNIIAFNHNLDFTGKLPPNFEVINPFKEQPQAFSVMEKFYNKYFNDSKKRKFIVGINPGRHGAAVTGVPFTDTKRMEGVCEIPVPFAHTHEPSSVFVYDVIEQFGGVQKFYERFYINSPFPLAIVKRMPNGKIVNANYYDYAELFEAVKPFMVQSIQQHISIGLETDTAYVLGKKNAVFIEKLNREHHFFEQIIPLDHPRYIQQYRSKNKQAFIDNYLQVLPK